MASGNDWMLIDAFEGKKKKKSKSLKQKKQYEMENEMDFEVIPKEQRHREFEVIPPQNIRLFDTNPLNVCEDYFSTKKNVHSYTNNCSSVNGKNKKKNSKRNNNNHHRDNVLAARQDSGDSDIEIISQSTIISDKPPVQSVETAEEALEEIEDAQRDDDSEIEVIGQGFTTDLLNFNQHHDEIVEAASPAAYKDDGFQIEFRDDDDIAADDNGDGDDIAVVNGEARNSERKEVKDTEDDQQHDDDDERVEVEDVDDDEGVEVEDVDDDEGVEVEDVDDDEQDDDVNDTEADENNNNNNSAGSGSDTESNEEDDETPDGIPKDVDMTGSFGLTSLFDSFYQQQSTEEEGNNNLVTLKTPTLVFMFCFSILIGVSLGQGFGSMVAHPSGTEKKNIKADESTAGSVEPSQEFLYINNDGEFSATRKTIQELLTSYRELEHDYRILKTGYDEYKQRYQLQKTMMWYWRKQAKLQQQQQQQQQPTIPDEPSKIENILTVSCYSNGTDGETLEIATTDAIEVVNLTKQLMKEREIVKYWKTKYTSLKLSKIRTCAKIGKSMAPSTFSFSGCLMMFSNAIPDLNISSSFRNISSQVESISDHVQNAWSNLKSRWRENASLKDPSKRSSAKAIRFRKMLTIGNLVNSLQKQATKNEVEDLKFCPDYKGFTQRWKGPDSKESSAIKRPQPTTTSFATKKSKRKYTIFNTNFQLDDDLHETPQKPCSGKKSQRDIKEIIKPCKGKERNDFLRPNSILMKEMASKYNEERKWLKKKLDDITFMFDVYKWNAEANVQSARDQLQQHIQVHAEYRKNRVKNLKKQKRILVDKIKELKEKFREKSTADNKMLQMERERNQEYIRELNTKLSQLREERQNWELEEKEKLTNRLQQLEAQIQKQKKTYKSLIKTLKKKFKERMKIRKRKLDYENKNHQILKLNIKKAERKVNYYKAKYDLTNQEKVYFRDMYQEMRELHQQSKDVIEHLERKLKDYRKIVRESKRHQVERERVKKLKKFKYLAQVSKNWESLDHDDVVPQSNDPYPSVFCPDKNNCQSDNNNGEQPATKKDSHLTVVRDPSHGLTKFSNDENLFLSTRPKDQPQLELKPQFFSQRPDPPRKPNSINFSWSAIRQETQPPKPSPPLRLKGEFGSLHSNASDVSEHNYENSAMKSPRDDDKDAYSWYVEQVDGHENYYRYNDYGTDDQEQTYEPSENWYLEMMNLRDTYRAEPDIYNERKVNQLNWYIKAMNDREEEREDWYVKWMKNRRKE